MYDQALDSRAVAGFLSPSCLWISAGREGSLSPSGPQSARLRLYENQNELKTSPRDSTPSRHQLKSNSANSETLGFIMWMEEPESEEIGWVLQGTGLPPHPAPPLRSCWGCYPRISEWGPTFTPVSHGQKTLQYFYDAHL
ncbi:hypothetical protein AOLI_G00201120 [Acnodon oligacanthus]